MEIIVSPILTHHHHRTSGKEFSGDFLCVDHSIAEWGEPRFYTRTGLSTSEPEDLPHFAVWIGTHFGLRVLDEFEIELINLRVIPISFPTYECEAVAFDRDKGKEIIVWHPKEDCHSCNGTGRLGDGDNCSRCFGSGRVLADQIKTDFCGYEVDDEN